MSKARLSLAAWALAAMVAAIPIASRAQTLDSTFGSDGLLTLPWNTAAWQWATTSPVAGVPTTLRSGLREEVLVVASNGEIFAAHEGLSDIQIIRMDTRGVPVANYVGGGVTRVPLKEPFYVGSIFVEAGGSLILGGVRDLIRVDAAGFVDTTFGEEGRMRIPYLPDGTCAGARIRRIFALPGGGWMVIGSQKSFLPQAGNPEAGCTFIARVRANGTIDLDFATQGNTVRPGFIMFDAVMGTDGMIQMVGRYAGQAGRWVERIDREGRTDNTFGTFGSLRLPENGPALAADDGRILADGSLVFVAASPQATLVFHRYRADFTLEPSFAGLGRSVIALNDLPFIEPTILPVADGGFIVRGSGTLNNGSGPTLAVFYKIDARGRTDTSFGEAGYLRFVAAATSKSLAWAIQPDGYVVFTGASHTIPAGPPAGTNPGPVQIQVNAFAARIRAIPRIVEFYNTITRHYFVAYDGLEASGIDGGVAGPGWMRTGLSFLPGGLVAVCRFYTPGANSHFFTAEPGECEEVKRAPGWIYEGLGFFATRLVNGACAAPYVAVIRYYNNRAAANDSNHRYATDPSVAPAMAAQGWTREGPVFCAKP